MSNVGQEFHFIKDDRWLQLLFQTLERENHQCQISQHLCVYIQSFKKRHVL
jgi:hypothetical protein